MAEMIYFYLSDGKTNCEIKFSHFFRRLILPLEGDDEQKRDLNFKMLDDDRNGFVSIPEIIKLYLELPKSSEYAAELRYIFKHYIDNVIPFQSVLKKKAKFDFCDYKSIIPYSCITLELEDRFIYRVKNNMICFHEKPNLD